MYLLDYGAGNVRSIINAMRTAGCDKLNVIESVADFAKVPFHVHEMWQIVGDCARFPGPLGRRKAPMQRTGSIIKCPCRPALPLRAGPLSPSAAHTEVSPLSPSMRFCGQLCHAPCPRATLHTRPCELHVRFVVFVCSLLGVGLTL